MSDGTGSEPAPVPAAGRRGAGVRPLAVGVLLAVALGSGILLLAGGLGVAGVVLAALVEAVLIWLLWRWSSAP